MNHTFQKYVIGFLCLFFIQTSLLSQEFSVILHQTSARENTKVYTEQEIARIEERLKQNIASIELSDKEQREALEKAYEDVAEALIARINSHELIFDPRLQKIVDQLAEEIFKANPQLPKEEINIYLSRADLVNAATYMNGTIVLYAGLIARMERIDELAFVLCHEITHYLNTHSKEDILTALEFANSEEVAEELKKINDSEYDRTRRFRTFMEDRVYEKGRHSRAHELEADSIGFELLRRTPYRSQGVIETLELLDNADKEISVLPSLKSTFDHPDFQFKSSWLQDEEEGFIFGGRQSVFNADSLKTHPDCKVRIQELSPLIDHSIPRSDLLAEEFKLLKKSLSFEIVEYYHDYGNYGRMIHQARLLLIQYPQNAYLHSRIGLGLLYIWQAQLNHEKGKVVPQPHPSFSESYKETLRMLHNMRLYELQGLAANYIDRYSSQMVHDEHFLFAMIKCAEWTERSDWESLTQKYRQQFPSGIYILETQ